MKIQLKDQTDDLFLQRGTKVRGLFDAIDSTEKVTYAELKALRDNDGLREGQWYRITDYITTTAQSNTRSAGHQFDVIVMALDSSTLCEDAYAAKHEYPADYIPEDTSAEDYQEKYNEVHYFDGIPLEAWQLKYRLDNDTDNFVFAMPGKTLLVSLNGISEQWYTRDAESDNTEGDYPFAWKRSAGTGIVYTAVENPAVEDMAYDNSVAASVVDSAPVLEICEGGKGVIYRMIDDRGNDCPYDFKNILQKRFMSTTEIIMPASYADDATYNYFAVAAIRQIADMMNSTSARETAPLAYGKLSNPVLGSTLTDSYVDSNLDAAVVDSSAVYNVFAFIPGTSSSSGPIANIYLKAGSAKYFYTFNYSSSCYDATVALAANIVYNNKIGMLINLGKRNINLITFLLWNTSNYTVFNNEIGENSYNLTFGQCCRYNRIADTCNAIFGYNCHDNTITQACCDIAFSGFSNNTFRVLACSVFNSSFGNNSFGGELFRVCFGKSCTQITAPVGLNSSYFGDSCKYLTFGSGCQNLYFGSDIQWSDFESGVQNIVFGTNMKDPQSHFANVKLTAANIRLYINCTDTTSSGNKCKYIYLPSMVNNSGTFVQLDVAAGNEFCTIFKRDDDVVQTIVTNPV